MRDCIVWTVGPNVVDHRLNCGKPCVIKNDVPTVAAQSIAEDKIHHDIIEMMPAININKSCAAKSSVVRELSKTYL